MSSNLDEFLNNYIQEEFFSHSGSSSDFPLDLQKVDKMSGKDFEKFCAGLLKLEGFSNIRITKSSGDHGVDVIAHKGGVSYAIQCKRHKKSVGNKAIQEVYTGMAIYKLDKSIVITNNYFSSQAIDDAKSLEVVLWDRRILRDKIEKIDNERKRREAEERRKREEEARREAARQEDLRRKCEEDLERRRRAVADEKGINKPAYGGSILRMEDIFHDAMYERNSDIRLVLGKDFHGNNMITSLVKSQHLLLFGCDQKDIINLLHCFISSILVGTDNFHLYIVENKGARLCMYKDISIVEHLNTITGAHSMIRWVVNDVNKRLAAKEELKADDITKIGFPRIIIVIEELTDLLGEYNSLEKEIEFLVQNGPDAGVSMIIASHYPSKTEYEDRIKELISVRACLRVVTSHESIMAIGVSGAEQLRGTTDFWFKGKDMVTPMQIRGPLMSDGDISKAIRCAQAIYDPIRYDNHPITEPDIQISASKNSKLKVFLRKLLAFFNI